MNDKIKELQTFLQDEFWIGLEIKEIEGKIIGGTFEEEDEWGETVGDISFDMDTADELGFPEIEDFDDHVRLSKIFGDYQDKDWFIFEIPVTLI